MQNSIYFLIFFYKFTKIKIKSFQCPKSIRNYKKICLEHQTLGRWVIRPSEPAYHIVNCQISVEQHSSMSTYSKNNLHSFFLFQRQQWKYTLNLRSLYKHWTYCFKWYVSESIKTYLFRVLYEKTVHLKKCATSFLLMKFHSIYLLFHKQGTG